MSIKQKIEQALTEKFQPELLEVINESYKHAGHMGDDGSDESHFKVVISGKNIFGNSRLEKHRNIHNALGDVIKQIHALQIELRQ